MKWGIINMNVKNMNQKQLENIRLILQTSNNNLFNLEDPRTKKCIFEVVANCDHEIVKAICTLINENKIINITDVIDYSLILSEANKHKDRGVTRNCEEVGDDYSKDTTYDYVVYTLSNFYNQKYIKIVSEIMMNIVTYRTSQSIYNDILNHPCFWNDLQSINILKNLAESALTAFKEWRAYIDERKQKGKTKYNFFSQIAYDQHYMKHIDEQKELNNYVELLANKYALIMANEKRNKSIYEVETLINQHNEAIAEKESQEINEAQEPNQVSAGEQKKLDYAKALERYKNYC
jgi:hypothetical protein